MKKYFVPFLFVLSLSIAFIPFGSTAQVSSSYARRYAPSTFAALGSPVNGSVRYCSNCTAGTNPCSSGGSGAVAERVNGAWRCDGGASATTPGGSSGDIQYNNAGAFGGSLLKQGTNTIEQYNSTSSQTLSVYGTRTDGSNYERLSITPIAIRTVKAGTGSNQNLTFESSHGGSIVLGGNILLGVNTYLHYGSHLRWTEDNLRDIGQSASDRPRTGYFGTSVRAPKFETAASVQWTSGTGSPEGVVTANVGSLYTRTDGGASTTLYVKESGAGNTGWVAK
jgi:hypothetical protein